MTASASGVSAWRRSGRLGRLAGWSVVSQAASAGSNSVVELGLAVFAGVEVLGAWAVYFGVLQTAIYLLRAAAGEPLLADAKPHDDLSSEPRVGSYLRLVAATGLMLALPVAVLGMALQTAGLLALAAALPVVLLQDALRHVAFWSLRPKVAAVLDLTWLGVTGLGVAVIGLHPTQSVAVAVWAGGAAVSAAVGFVLIRPRASGSIRAWWYSVRSLAAATTTDTVMYLASNQWLWFWVSATSGDAALGAYRVALLAANPAMLMFLATQTLIIPGVTRRGHVPRWGFGAIAALPVAGVALTAALAVGLTQIAAHTEFASGEVSVSTWVAAGLYVASGGVAGPLAAVMRALRRGRRLVMSRAISTLVTIVCALAMVPTWETTGLLLAQTAGLVVFAVGCAASIRSAGHEVEHKASRPSDDEGAEDQPLHSRDR